MSEHPALLASQLEDGKVRCEVCAHRCVINPGQKGFCKVRENRGGKLFSLSYGRLVAAHVDPIEKKPLYHFLPGSLSYSIAAPGCNFRCKWCQNEEIAQISPSNEPGRLPYTPPERVVEAAIATGCQSVAFTYTEPTISLEYNLDVSRLAHDAGLKTIYITNGYMTPEMLELTIPTLDAANVDIKAFDESIHRKYTAGHLQPVLDVCVALHKAGVWLEVTTLLIPGINDDETQLQGVAEFIAAKLSTDVPWHISRYFPQPHFHEIPATPARTIFHAIDIGRKAGLRYVYGGNLQTFTDTDCPNCGERVVRRMGYADAIVELNEGACPKCGFRIAGVW
jgi:pyruvate formate lyase activating enzyme